jgi:hypothetical protein
MTTKPDSLGLIYRITADGNIDIVGRSRAANRSKSRSLFSKTQTPKPKMNIAAQQLGRLGAGKPKTLSKEAIQQRRKAARISANKRKGIKIGPREKRAPDKIVVESARPVEPEIDDTIRCCIECGHPYENQDKGAPCTYCPGPLPETPTETVDPDFEAKRHLLA